MSNPVYTEKVNGYTISIFQDEDAESPRDWDNIGTMICFHRNYSLGDKHKLTVDEAKELEHRGDIITIPLYLYDHGGITMSTGPFCCPWDSGRVGFIYADHEKICKEYKVEPGKDGFVVALANAKKSIEQEVKTYDDYLQGNVWGYVIIDADGEHVDSCWGFIGDYDEDGGAFSEASQIASNLKESVREDTNTLYECPNCGCSLSTFATEG